jgi:hypothetical protein
MPNDRDGCNCKEIAHDGKYCSLRMLSRDGIVSRIPTKLTGNLEGIGGDAVGFWKGPKMAYILNASIKPSNRLNSAHS